MPRSRKPRGAVAGHALTLRLSPAAGRADDLRDFFRSLTSGLADRPGLVGAHLLKHEAPTIAATTEQRIRGTADRVADWICLVCGYDPTALRALADADLASDALVRHGAAAGAVCGFHRLSYSATPVDVI